MNVGLSCSYGKRWRMFYGVTEIQQFLTDVPYLVIYQDDRKTVIMLSECKEIIIKE